MSEYPLEWVVLAAVHLWQKQLQQQQQEKLNLDTAISPWLLSDNWRLNTYPSNRYSLWSDKQQFDVLIHSHNDFIEAALNKKFYFIQVKKQSDDFIQAVVNNKPYQLNISDNESQLQLQNENAQLILWTSPLLSRDIL